MIRKMCQINRFLPNLHLQQLLSLTFVKRINHLCNNHEKCEIKYKERESCSSSGKLGYWTKIVQDVIPENYTINVTDDNQLSTVFTNLDRTNKLKANTSLRSKFTQQWRWNAVGQHIIKNYALWNFFPSALNVGQSQHTLQTFFKVLNGCISTLFTIKTLNALWKK